MAEVTDVIGTKKLQVQLGIPFFILMGFVVGVLVFGTLYFGSKLGGGGGGQNPQEIAKEGSGAISSYIVQKISTLSALAEDSQSSSFDTSDEKALREALSTNRDILAIAFFDDVGREIFELHKSRIVDEALKGGLRGDLYLGILKGRSRSYLLLSSNTTPASLYIAVPVRDDSEELSSFMVATLDASHLSDVISIFGSDNPVKVQIVDSKSANVLLSRSSLTNVKATEGPTIEETQRLFESNKKEFGYETDSGVTVVSAWEPIEETNWNLVAHTLSGRLTKFGVAVFTGGTIVIILFAAISFLFISILNVKLIQPLKKIEKAMHYYRTGDYSEEIKVDTKNELANIAGLLNNMARNVENNTSERVSQLKKVLDRQNTDTRLLIEKDVELREKSQKLKELDSAKSMFVSVAAHQMRTPLAAVKWAIKLVMDGDVGPVNVEQIEYLNKGYESTTRMINLINDLLNVDKIESDKFTYEFKPESLTEMLQGIVDDLTPISSEKGVHLVFEHEKGKQPNISADKVKLTNALQNLIDNAIKYTIGGGDVTVKLVLEKEIYKLSISDTGIGIPISEQSKVFGKFFRAKNAVRQQTDGSGLGLFIVKKIIEKHGGTAVFESKEKKGTTFFIEIPILKNNTN